MDIAPDGDELEFFESINVRFRSFVPGENRHLTQTGHIDARSLRRAALEHAQAGDRLGVPRCIISGQTLAEAAFTSEEHFIPEGLGFAWTKLPVGTGTCDDVNRRFSRYEMEWLRHGMMGFVRPHYVPFGKGGPPVFHAPNRESSVLTFSRDPKNHSRRVIELNGDFQTRDLADGGVAIDVEVPGTDARPAYVSPALHKLGLLGFWVLTGAFAFDDVMRPLRASLMDKALTKATFRPYFEVLTGEASPPGCSLSYDVLSDGKHRPKEIRCCVRLHSVVYGFYLVGEPTDEALPPGAAWREWADPADVKQSMMHLQFRASSMTEDTGPAEPLVWPWQTSTNKRGD